MRVLCVAEKPSAAKKIAGILSQNRFNTSPTSDVHIKNYEFTYNLQNTPTTFVMTALKGHLLELEFAGDINKNWSSHPLEDLFYVPLRKVVNDKMKPIYENIKTQARRADVIFIWTDCDREGEAIGADVVDLCRDVNSNIRIWRARFSSMQNNAINHAAQHHEELDMKQVEAVRARSELDLRIGAAFTRLQTMQLRTYFHQEENKVLSYGSCQFPTLGFVVERSRQVDNFIPEEFWKITMTHVQQREDPQHQQQPITTTFNWRRNHLFDRWACFIFYEICVEKKVATITKVKSKQTSKWKPLPLTTVEMQKIACRALGTSGAEIMSIAEELYTAGLISYPRTETDQYEQGFDFMSLINMQSQDNVWGEYARIIKDGEFETPRNGRNNDKAHPPIHPTAYDTALSGNKRLVYEFIVRRFLGSCWKNAIGYETTIEARMDTEFFDAKGLVILERNYLEVYTYDKWNGNEIPEFHEGEEFVPATLEMKPGQTTAPKYLTETDLISLMEKHEIGTDATIAEHIQKILDRRYVYKENQYFKPLTLGTALILGYDQVGLEAKLSKPDLRRQMEADLKSICLGTISPNDVRTASIHRYQDMFHNLKREFQKVKQSMDSHFREREDQSNAPLNQYRRGGFNGDGGWRGGGFNNGGGNGRGNGSGGGGFGNNDNSSGRGGGRGSGRGSGRGARGASARGASNGTSRFHGSNDNNITAPNCAHGKPAVTRKVVKEGPNKGREFYTCGEMSSCDFFEWADGLTIPSTTGPRNFNTNNNHEDDSGYPYCTCSKKAVKRTVTNVNSENRGKTFFCCIDGRDRGCSFFEWIE